VTIPLTAITGDAVAARLLELDLLASELQQSAKAGYTAAANCTDHEPRIYKGMTPWAIGLAHLRDLTSVRGWRVDRAYGYETAAHPSNAHAIALSAGSPDTGRANATPRTRNPKGEITKQIVARNNRQLSLGAGNNEFAGTGEPEIPDAKRVTWFLLHYYDLDKGEIRLELSCPWEMTGCQISEWRERLILEPVSFNGSVETPIEPEEDIEIDIDISRRAD
jgi:hypothetical protein